MFTINDGFIRQWVERLKDESYMANDLGDSNRMERLGVGATDEPMLLEEERDGSYASNAEHWDTT